MDLPVFFLLDDPARIEAQASMVSGIVFHSELIQALLKTKKNTWIGVDRSHRTGKDYPPPV